jgi:ATP-dependent RNA helicase DHX37/DHR1
MDPQKTRTFIISTNVAETSITIPNIKYVVDSGKHKEKEYKENSNICEYKIKWISQASSKQRMGRAGRT